MLPKHRHFFASESVTKGHPDKVADQISDAVLDHILTQDHKSRVACEVLVTTGLCLVAGEITTNCWVDIAEIARGVIKSIGYNDSSMGFDWKTCSVLCAIGKQSPDIAMGVNPGVNREQGAGDQGMMFGYAVNETPELMPMPIMLAHKLCRRLAEARENGEIPYLRPDGKSQVVVEYEDRRPVRVHTVLVSTQHDEEASHEEIKRDVIEKIVRRAIPASLLDEHTVYHVNPTGRFVIGGPHGDCGLTGRKIIVDTYGGRGRHGGGAFSGKDPSKVDRSAAYACRWIAKNVVAAGLAEECEIQISYAIGIARPLSIRISTFGTGKVDDERLAAIIAKYFDLRPAAIIERLDLLKPKYQPTAVHGHFGRNEDGFTWEKTDMAEIIRAEAGI